MKQWIIGTAALLSLASCNGEKEKENSDGSDLKTDTLITVHDEYKKAKATKTDAIFDDFLLSFATDSVTQWSRTHFPLSYTVNGNKREFTPQKWKMDKLFSGEDLYTIIFNTENDLDLPTHTDLQQGSFEWIMPETQVIKRYNFKRNDQQAWILNDIEQFPISESCNADFLEFYQRFSTNVDFQKKHVKNSIVFVTNFTDDNDGFSTDRFTVDADQFIAWNVPMPTKYLTNIVYGPSCKDKDPSLKILCIKAMDGAFFKALYFRKNRAEWQLYKYEDTAY